MNLLTNSLGEELKTKVLPKLEKKADEFFGDVGLNIPNKKN